MDIKKWSGVDYSKTARIAAYIRIAAEKIGTEISNYDAFKQAQYSTVLEVKWTDEFDMTNSRVKYWVNTKQDQYYKSTKTKPPRRGVYQIEAELSLAKIYIKELQNEIEVLKGR